MINNIIVLFFLFIGVVACSEKSKIEKMLKQIKSTPLVLPSHDNMIAYHNDSVLMDFSKAELKFVVYTDSLECASCAMNRMYEWEDITKLDSVYSGRIKFYFIFTPKQANISQILRTLRAGALPYPSFVDKTGEFLKENLHIPADRRLHAFLLDKDNHVILVGNPLSSEDTRKLFYQEVTRILTNKNGEVSGK